MKLKLAKLIRIITVPPIMAILMITFLHFFSKDVFVTWPNWFFAILFIAILPLFAYPFSLFFHGTPEQKRRKQRQLAIIFSVTGYVAGFVFSILSKAPNGEMIVYATYLISGILTALLSFLTKLQSSGHACGVSGPIAMLVYCISPYWLFAYALLPVVIWSSITLKRHTFRQLAVGSVVPIVAMLLSILLIQWIF